MTHTPGPWHVQKGLYIRNQQNLGVAMAYLSPRLTPEATLANARLIAAAPDLLAAARQAYSLLRLHADTDGKMRVANALVNAIDKADGREP